MTTPAKPRDGITINADQRVFVIPAGGGGYSCLGFDNCYRDTVALAERLGRPDLAPVEADRGTLANFARRDELVGLIGTRDIGTWFTPGTPEAVQRILERARLSGERLKITLGDRDTGRIWDDRPESGTIGRSGGSMKVPLLIANRRSSGGGAILTDCVVKIETSRGSTTLYAHKDLHAAPSEVTPVEPEPASAPAP